MSAGVPPKTLLPITAPSYTASPRIAPGPKTFFNKEPLAATSAVLTNCLAAFLSPDAAAFLLHLNHL